MYYNMNRFYKKSIIVKNFWTLVVYKYSGKS